MNEITNNLFQSDAVDAIANRHGNFDCIVYVGQKLPHELAFNSIVPIIHIPLADGIDNPKKWFAVYDILYTLMSWNDKVLVTCRAGMSRSPMIVLYYLVRSGFAKDYDEAYKFVKEKVPVFQPEQNMADMVKKMLEK